MEPREPVDVKILGDAPHDDVEVKILETPLSEVERIERQTNLPIRSVEDVKEVFEAPLVKAGQILFAKGIKTTYSSANRLHVESGNSEAATLTINTQSLSPENLEIARNLANNPEPSRGYKVIIERPEDRQTQYGMRNDRTDIIFTVPMEEGITLEEIERRSVDFANHFEPNELIKVDVPDSDDTIKIDVP